MIGIGLVAGSALSRRHTSKPSMPGIMISSRIKSGLVFWAMLSAVSPFFATSSLPPTPFSSS